MSCSYRSFALLAAGLFVAACQEGTPTAPAEADLEMQAAMSVAGNAAVASGDTALAAVLRDGAAGRWGIRPSQIEVKIKNEKFTYLAIVVGRERRRDDGTRELLRTLVAWTGRPVTAVLHVATKSDHGLFGPPNNGNGDGPDGARGQWKDLVAQQLWIATAGSADLELLSTGGACPVQPADARLRCVLASYDVRVNGNFQLLGPDGPDGNPIEIHTNADGVHGVVIKPAP